MQSAKSMMGMGQGSKFAPVKAKSLDGGADEDFEESKGIE